VPWEDRLQVPFLHGRKHAQIKDQIWFGVQVVRGLYAIRSRRESGWPWMIANSIHVWSSSPRTDVLGHSQPSPFDKLRAGSSGLIGVVDPTQDYVLGYSQPELSKLADWSSL
jgi:hypothetical protein